MTADLRDAVAGAIEEAILRVTDGAVRFDDEQLRRIGDEFLTGEVFGSRATLESRQRAVRIVLTEREIPVNNRRPAPSLFETWAAHPKLLARQAEHAADEDPQERLWGLVAQPLYSPDTPFDGLPDRIIRQCCQYKDCGGTALYLNREETTWGPRFDYRRVSNDDAHDGFRSYSVAGLVEQLNNPEWWPNQHCDVVWGSVGQDGFDALDPGSAVDTD